MAKVSFCDEPGRLKWNCQSNFEKVSSLFRHGKYSEAEEIMNQAEWNVPIDFQNDQGNALIHIACQNGNKRLLKLCLRRGANVDIQNFQGQTALHFLYAFGYTELGEYLIQKGANDSICNNAKFSCYEVDNVR